MYKHYTDDEQHTLHVYGTDDEVVREFYAFILLVTVRFFLLVYLFYTRALMCDDDDICVCVCLI